MLFYPLTHLPQIGRELSFGLRLMQFKTESHHLKATRCLRWTIRIGAARLIFHDVTTYHPRYRIFPMNPIPADLPNP